MSDNIRAAFGRVEKARVRTLEDLQKDYGIISARMEENKRNRTELSQQINTQKKTINENTGVN